MFKEEVEMLKKVLSATIVLALVSATGSVAYSDVATDKENLTNLGLITGSEIEPTAEIQVSLEKQLEVYKPENGVISDKIVLLSGIAEEGSKIIVEIYSTPNISLEDYNLYEYNLYNVGIGDLSVLDVEDNVLNQDIYLPPVVKEIEVGAFGYFAEELELKFGLNKINVYIEGSEDSQVKYVYVNDYSKADELIKKIDDMDVFNTMKQIFGQEEDEDDFMKLNSMPELQLPEDEEENEINSDETKDELNLENEEQENNQAEETEDIDDSKDVPVENNTNKDGHED